MMVKIIIQKLTNTSMNFFKYHISCGLLMESLWFGGGQEAIACENTANNTWVSVILY